VLGLAISLALGITGAFFASDLLRLMGADETVVFVEVEGDVLVHGAK